MKNGLKVLKFIKPHIFLLVLAVLCAFVSVSLTLYIPVMVGNAVDVMLGKGRVDMGEILSVALKIAVSVGIIAVFQWLMTQSANAISARTTRDLRGEVFAKFNEVSLARQAHVPRWLL